MLTTDKILYEILVEEVFFPYMTCSLLEEKEFEDMFEVFVSVNELTSFKVDEDLSDDFETSGHITYNVNSAVHGSFITATFNYCDGDLEHIEYDVKETELYNGLISYALRTITKILETKTLLK